MKVLVTHATRNTSLAVIRSLSKAGYKVVGADYRNLLLNTHSRYTGPNQIFTHPQHKNFIKDIIKIIQKEKPDVLFPIGNSRRLSMHRNEICRYTHLLMPSYETVKIVQNKKTTIEECKKIGVVCPEIFTADEAEKRLKNNACAGTGLKAVIKPRMNIGGSQGVWFAGDIETFQTMKKKCESVFGEALIQEYIPGNTERKRSVVLLFDEKSRLTAYFTSRFIREWPITGGSCVLGISTHEKELVDLILPFFEKFQWQGPAEIEFKIDRRDNKPKLIEINPSYSGNIGFPILCGANFPLIHCNLALKLPGRTEAYPKYAVGVKYIDPTSYIKAILAEGIKKENKLDMITEIISDLKGKKVTNYLEFADGKVIAAKMLSEIIYLRKDRTTFL